MQPGVLIAVYCALIVVASLAGGWLPSVMRLTHLRMQIMMSLVSGMMIGVAVLHLLPHAAEYLPDGHWLSGSLLCGLLMMLFLLRFGHVHHHHGDPGQPHGCGHDHDHDHDTQASDEPQASRMSWLGLLIGLALHTVFDGIALGASVVADAGHDHGTETGLALFGLGTFLAVVLHKPLDAMAITSVMQVGGWSTGSRWLINSAFALMCPAGAVLFWLGVTGAEGENYLVGCALAFSAGAFLCIALTDLLPEALEHSHDRLKLSVALLVGTALAVGIEMLPGHSHEGPHLHSTPTSHGHHHAPGIEHSR
jgi:zinc and cadmium transporter